MLTNAPASVSSMAGFVLALVFAVASLASYGLRIRRPRQRSDETPLLALCRERLRERRKLSARSVRILVERAHKTAAGLAHNPNDFGLCEVQCQSSRCVRAHKVARAHNVVVPFVVVFA